MVDALERYRWVVVLLLALPVVVAIGVLIGRRTESAGPLVIVPGTPAPGELRVYVTGAVNAPGVYPLSDGARWIDALTAAGGATSEADLAAVNLARRAVDEDEIVVPRIGGTAVAGASQEPALVHLNSATAEELETLPGIGATRGEAIVQSRTTAGAFGQAEDLVLRKLVPESVFREIAAMITVD